MRWRKVVGIRFHSLEKRERRRGQGRTRRYSKWRGDRCRWMRIVNIMDVWGKRREHVEGQEEKGERHGRERHEGDGATGTVNVGVSSAIVNIGTTTNTAVALGKTGGSVTLGPPLTLGAGPGLSTNSGATGTFNSDLLGHTEKINSTSLTISNYNVTNSVASYRVDEDGVYLVTWSIQQQITTPPNGMVVNVSINNTSITTTTGTVGFANWGMTKYSNIIYGSSGSIIAQIPASHFCNLILTVDGGSGFSTPAITYCLSRIG